MTSRIDPDLLALKQACKALAKSTSRRMLKANIDFIVDRFLTHPSKGVLYACDSEEEPNESE